jgi:hypothetical protein
MKMGDPQSFKGFEMKKAGPLLTLPLFKILLLTHRYFSLTFTMNMSNRLGCVQGENFIQISPNLIALKNTQPSPFSNA